MTIEFIADDADLRAVRTVLLSFAEGHKLTIQDVGATFPPIEGRRVFFFNLYRDDQTKFVVENIKGGGRLDFLCYRDGKSHDSDELINAFIDTIKGKWPDAAVSEN